MHCLLAGAVAGRGRCVRGAQPAPRRRRRRHLHLHRRHAAARITSDRPIPDCIDREQTRTEPERHRRAAGSSPPTPPSEQAEREERERQAADAGGAPTRSAGASAPC